MFPDWTFCTTYAVHAVQSWDGSSYLRQYTAFGATHKSGHHLVVVADNEHTACQEILQQVSSFKGE